MQRQIDGYTVSSLKFGTSGLRGLVTDLLGWPSYAYASAFFRSVAAADSGSRIVVIGRDLRDSSSSIAATVASAAASTNGPVEGQVNRRKLIKRSMYGRAGLELLRQRVVHAA